MDPWIIFWGIFISLIGFGFLRYGKKRPDGDAIVTGLVLMIYPYFITSIAWSISIGIAVCALYFLLHKYGF